MRNNASTRVLMEEVEVGVPGGNAITGTLRLPRDGVPIGVTVMHPATGVPERLYASFAEHLAESGFAVVTYDYRGTGRSGNPRQHPELRMRDWMNVDVPAVAAWARGRFPALPQVAVGHSVGGHALSLDGGTADVRGFISIASHAGVTRAIRQPGERLKVGIILRVLGPVLSRTLGYFPGRRLGVGEDLPAGAMLEWSRWSRMPGYFFDDPSMDAATRAARVRCDALVIGFTDDPWATPGQIDAIADHLGNATVERRTYDPAEAGVTAIGHMGFFRRGLRQSLWPQVTDWLTDRVTAVP